MPRAGIKRAPPSGSGGTAAAVEAAACGWVKAGRAPVRLTPTPSGATGSSMVAGCDTWLAEAGSATAVLTSASCGIGFMVAVVCTTAELAATERVTGRPPSPGAFAPEVQLTRGCSWIQNQLWRWEGKTDTTSKCLPVDGSSRSQERAAGARGADACGVGKRLGQ